MTITPTAVLLGDCDDARDHFGISTECGPADDHHPSRLIEVVCGCSYRTLICPALAHDAEFVRDQPKEGTP